LLVVEDVQWLGELGAVFSHLLNAVELATPLVVIATARHPAAATVLQGLVTGDAARLRVIEVEALTLEQGRLLIEQLLPGANLPEALESELHAKSLGLPYYYEEVARLLLRRGAIVPAEDTGAATDSTKYTTVGMLNNLPIPDDLRTLILGRLDMLPAKLRELAQHASVLGRSFELESLIQLEQKISAVSREELVQALAELHQERILHPDQGQRVDLAEIDNIHSDNPRGSDRYFFLHILTRESAYASLLSRNRKRLHRVAAENLKSGIVPGTVAERDLLPQLVSHYEGASMPLEAFAGSCELLDNLNDYGHADLWQNYHGQARFFLSQIGSGPAQTHLDARLALSESVMLMESGEPLVARRKLRKFLREARTNDQLYAHFLRRLAGLYQNAGDYSKAERYFRRSLTLARRTNNFPAMRKAAAGLGQVALAGHSYAKAAKYYRWARRLSASSGDLNGLAYMELCLGNLYHLLGKYDRANRSFDRAGSHFRALGNERKFAWALAFQGHMYSLQNKSLEALGLISEASRLSRANLDLYGQANASFLLAFELRGTDPPAAIEHATMAIEAFIRLNERVSLIHAYCVLAHAQLLSGANQSAGLTVQRARAAVDQAPLPERIMLDCVTVMLLRSIGDHHGAVSKWGSTRELRLSTEVYPHIDYWLDLAGAGLQPAPLS
jgi:tetratricopeptide (TPR) repeat protein